jgi:hypothetical protein
MAKHSEAIVSDDVLISALVRLECLKSGDCADFVVDVDLIYHSIEWFHYLSCNRTLVCGIPKLSQFMVSVEVPRKHPQIAPRRQAV